MTDTKQRIRLLDLAEGAIALAPDWQQIASSLFGLVTLRKGSRQSLGKAFERCVSNYPDKPALLFEDRSFTYAELNAWANQMAHALTLRGVRKGDCVGLVMENRPELVACVLATVKLGAVAGLINTNQKSETLLHSLNLLKARCLLVGQECLVAVREAMGGAKALKDQQALWVPQRDTDKAPLGLDNLLELAVGRPVSNPKSTQDILASDPCFYIFTSGTTGMPKASIMTHFRWLSAMNGFGSALRLKPDDVLYCCLPLYHNNALTVSWGSVLASGATLALDKKFSASRFWDRIRHYRATSFCYIGELLRYLLNRPASHGDQNHEIRLIVGNGLRPELWGSFEKRFGIDKIYEFYGASESNIGFINVFGQRNTVGFTPMPFAIVQCDPVSEEPMRKANGRMIRVKAGEVGLLISEVTERKPFDGYTDEQASEKKLLRNVFKQGDCWFNSGDLVRSQGWQHIQFVDRLGDTFRWKGENVATSEVEGAMALIDSIEHAVVYGVEIPGHDGRAGMAAISLKPGHAFDGELIAHQLRSSLPAYCIPVFIRVRQEQDTTGTFKYQKSQLKKQGFNITELQEPLYALLDKQPGYVSLTPDVYRQILQGELRP
jgi:acyl-CoA synthetase (AMP-forming)/AMP-acid ligase II